MRHTERDLARASWLPAEKAWERTMAIPERASIEWERDWQTAVERAGRERRLLLIDVEKDH